MFRFFLLVISILLLFSTSICASKTELSEVYFSFSPGNRVVLNKLIRFMAIDKRSPDGTVFAYSDSDVFKKLSSYTLIDSPNYSNVMKLESESRGVSKLDMGSYKTVSEFRPDVYPDYHSYVSLMHDFARTYPDICRLEVVGNTPEGRKILALKISDNVEEDEKEPEVLFDSTIHGNEITGYPLLLTFIYELLTNYDSDKNIKSLVDSTEIWFMPLRNPDGAYRSGNFTLRGATRFNSNMIDLNRNFPDTSDRSSVFSKELQPETVAIMNFAARRNITMGATIHGGAEVLNYPWDSMEQKHPDDDWFVTVTREYVDRIHASDSEYMNDLDDGITNGYAWYSIIGGFQDYMNYFLKSRVITFELSTSKAPKATDILDYWDKNRNSMLGFIKRAQMSIRGIVVDEKTGAPIEAHVYLSGVDEFSVGAKSSKTNGDFFRPVLPGKYKLNIKAKGYETKTIDGILVEENSVPEGLSISLKAI